MFYTNWFIGEPNDDGRGEDCVEIWEKRYGWNDIKCAQTNPFICQKPQGKSVNVETKCMLT